MTSLKVLIKGLTIGFNQSKLGGNIIDSDAQLFLSGQKVTQNDRKNDNISLKFTLIYSKCYSFLDLVATNWCHQIRLGMTTKG
ncbi:hypothetical protein [Terasakiella pusilla]|jgi:hypothetical protein|uniref:hypothetical protein n=1 Tax=Terasakiella pusilla TaxID=64973 RepID=UPI00068F3A91